MYLPLVMSMLRIEREIRQNQGRRNAATAERNRKVSAPAVRPDTKTTPEERAEYTVDVVHVHDTAGQEQILPCSYASEPAINDDIVLRC